MNKSFLYCHINSKVHKDIEEFLKLKCMTFSDCCDKEIEYEEWRDHIFSEDHLESEAKQ